MVSNRGVGIASVFFLYFVFWERVLFFIGVCPSYFRGNNAI